MGLHQIISAIPTIYPLIPLSCPSEHEMALEVPASETLGRESVTPSAYPEVCIFSFSAMVSDIKGACPKRSSMDLWPLPIARSASSPLYTWEDGCLKKTRTHSSMAQVLLLTQPWESEEETPGPGQPESQGSRSRQVVAIEGHLGTPDVTRLLPF